MAQESDPKTFLNQSTRSCRAILKKLNKAKSFCWEIWSATLLFIWSCFPNELLGFALHFFWLIIVEYTWFNRLAKFQSCRPQRRVATGETKWKSFDTPYNWVCPPLFWWIIVQYARFNRLAKFQSYRPSQKRVAKGQTKSLPCQNCARDFSTQGFFAICFPGFLIEFYANKCYPMFQLLEFYMVTKNHFCKLKWCTTFQN